MEVLGIDVGGTGIKGAIVNVNTGELVSDKHRIATPTSATPDEVADIIAQFATHFNWKGKIGCGFPTIIYNGLVASYGNLDTSWVGVQADELFSQRTGLSVTVVNDADAAGTASILFGKGKGIKGTVIIITIGTGLGSGVFFDGKLIPNYELGVIPHKKHERFEYYAAESVRKKEDLTYKEWGKRFNKFLVMIERVFSPSLIILGGGASKKLNKYQEYFTVEVPVVASQFVNNVGIIGSALIAK